MQPLQGYESFGDRPALIARFDRIWPELAFLRTMVCLRELQSGEIEGSIFGCRALRGFGLL